MIASAYSPKDKAMRKTLMILFVLTISSFCAQAQVSGFLGKRVVLKTDLMHLNAYDAGYNLQLEMALMRHTSIQVEYHQRENQYGSYLKRPGGINYIDDDAQVASWEVAATLKFYPSRAIPAPKGWYNYIQASRGQADVSGRYLERDFNTDVNREYDFNIRNATYSSYETGIGVQTFLLKRIALDFAFGLNYSEIDAEDSNYLIEEMRYRHGSNLLIVEPNTRFVGLAAHISVGLLLF
jgi:opacity protein-like surface antigen